jgi:hypothetical protein
MKTILTLLTGIVFLITILTAGACGKKPEQKGEPLADKDSTVEIYLKNVSINGRMHLEMYNEKDSLHKKIDSLETVVYPGYHVVFYNAKKSKIKKVHNMRPAEGQADIFNEVDSLDRKGLFELEIYSDAPDSTKIKYEIIFTVKELKDGEEKETTWYIDPFLRIPPGP